MLSGLDCSGFGWDPKKKIITTEKAVWDAYILVCEMLLFYLLFCYRSLLFSAIVSLAILQFTCCLLLLYLLVAVVLLFIFVVIFVGYYIFYCFCYFACRFTCYLPLLYLLLTILFVVILA